MGMRGEYFDCQFLNGEWIHPGETCELPVSFLDPESALRGAEPGTRITLRAVGTIAEGVFVSVVTPSPRGTP